jgi:hypothetical protein
LFLIIHVVYGIIASRGTAETPYWELLFLKTVTVILVALTISCFCVWLAWILFSKQELSIDASDIRYKFTVIFPVIRRTIPISEISFFSVYQRNYGVGIFFSTMGKSRHIFHIANYNCSRSHEKEISELTAIVHSIKMFLKQQKKENGYECTTAQKTNSQTGRWKYCYVDEYQRFKRFTRIGRVLPCTSYILCIIAGLFSVGVTSIFSIVAFYPNPPGEIILLPTLWAIRIFSVMLIFLCIYFFISLAILILHPFTRFNVLVYPDRVMSCRNFFGLSLTQTWYYTDIKKIYTDIKKIKKSHTKKYTVWDFFRNPESTDGQINPAPCSIQFIDQHGNILGEIKDLLSEEIPVFINTIEESAQRRKFDKL